MNPTRSGVCWLGVVITTVVAVILFVLVTILAQAIGIEIGGHL